MTLLRHEPDHLANWRRIGAAAPSQSPQPGRQPWPVPQVRFDVRPRTAETARQVQSTGRSPAEPRRIVQPYPVESRVDVFLPRHDIRIDTMFWQHRSPFVGTQEQLNELRRDANKKSAERAVAEFMAFINTRKAKAEESILVAHRPIFKRLLPVLLVGLVPFIWAKTSCQCGDRWPCNDMKLFIRHRFGWSRDFNESLKTVTAELPKPDTRWTRLKRWLTRHRPQQGGTDSDPNAGKPDNPRNHEPTPPRRPSPHRRERDCNG